MLRLVSPRSAIGLTLGLVLAGGVLAGPSCSPFTSSHPPASTGAETGPPTEAGTDARSSCVGADTSSDPRHCGACERDCGGGLCMAGNCTAYVIADSPSPPWYLAVDGERVFWTAFLDSPADVAAGDGSIRWAPKGGGPAPLLATTVAAYSLLPSAGQVIYTSGGGVFRVPQGGGSSSPLDANTNDALEIAAYGQEFFFTGGATIRGVYAVALNGATRTLGDLELAEGIAVDDTGVYVAVHSPTAGAIVRMDRDGNNRGTLVNDQPMARRIAVDADAVYWTSDASGGGIRKSNKHLGGKVTVLVEDLVGYGSLIVDESHVYATLQRAGTVVRVNKADGSGRLELAAGLTHPIGLAADADALYFGETLNNGRGRIWRIRK